MPTIRPNPFRDIYTHSGKTLDELSEEFGIQRSFIQRLLEGCFPSPPPSLTQKFSRLSGLPAVMLAGAYREHVKQSRKELVFPVGMNKDMSVEEWLKWADKFCYMNNVEMTRLNVAALLHLNVNVIANWENGKTEKLPAQILQVVNAA